MLMRTPRSLCGILGIAAALALSAGTGQAKSSSQKECSEKYQAAKAANTLNGLTYNQFRKQCATEAREDKAATPASAPAPVPTAAPAAPAPAPAAPTVAAAPKPAPSAAATTPARPTIAPSATASVGNTVYPTAVSAAYAGEKPGKARMKTCLDQYHANKTGNGNGGMKWIQAGGGYYSECNKRLKT